MNTTQTMSPDLALHLLILERLAIGVKVGFRWRTLEPIGEEALERALEQGLLREAQRAETVPHPDPSSPTLNPLEVRHCADGIYAVAAEGDAWVEPVKLTENLLRQFELAPGRLWARICADNHINQAIRENEHEIVYLGDRDLPGHGLLMIYFLYNNREELGFVERCRRIAGERWTVALTPVPVPLSLQSQRQIAPLRLALTPMSIHLDGDDWSLPWGKIAADMSSRGKGVEPYQPEADLTFNHLPGLSFSPDFRVVHRRGKQFVLTESMVKILKFMVNNSPSGPRDIPQQRILEECECRSKSLVFIFKRLPDWKELIAPGSKKGTYRLNL